MLESSTISVDESTATSIVSPSQGSNPTNVNVFLNSMAPPQEIQDTMDSMKMIIQELLAKSQERRKIGNADVQERAEKLITILGTLHSQTAHLNAEKHHYQKESGTMTKSLEAAVQEAVAAAVTESVKETTTHLTEMRGQLTELTEKLKDQDPSLKPMPMYSSVAKLPPREIKKKQETAAPILVVKSKTGKEDSQKIRDVVRKAASISGSKIRPDEIILTQYPRIVLKFMNRKEAEQFKTDIQQHIDEDRFQIILPRIKWKSVVLLGAPNTLKPEEVFEELTYILPFDPQYLKIAFTTKPKGNFVNHVVEMDTLTYVELLKRKRIFLDYTSVRIQPNFRTIRCRNCQIFGHVAQSCKNNVVCPVCAQNHAEESCPRETNHCINCEAAELPHHHPAFFPGCGVFKSLREAFVAEEMDFVTQFGADRV